MGTPISSRRHFRMSSGPLGDNSLRVACKHVDNAAFIMDSKTRKTALGLIQCPDQSSDSKLALGMHAAGTVEAIGASVQFFKPGDKVLVAVPAGES